MKEELRDMIRSEANESYIAKMRENLNMPPVHVVRDTNIYDLITTAIPVKDPDLFAKVKDIVTDGYPHPGDNFNPRGSFYRILLDFCMKDAQQKDFVVLTVTIHFTKNMNFIRAVSNDEQFDTNDISSLFV